MHGGECGAPKDMGTWVLWWHCSTATGAQAELPKEAKAISSAKQDAHRGGCLRSPQETSPHLPGGKNQETTVSAAFSTSNRGEQVSPGPANYSLVS